LVFGGSPFNCCIAAHRRGLPVSVLGGLSTDLFGEKLRGHLQSEGVDLQLAPSFPNPTTLAFVSREEGKGEQYAFFKENAADRSIKKGIIAKAMYQKRFRAVHMSLGAVTLEDQQCAEAFQTFFSIAAKQGALRCFDPNIRANMIKKSGAEYSKMIEKLLRSVDLAKTSEEDAEFMYGEGVNLETIAVKWLKLGPKMVVFTLGSKGCTAFVSGEGAELIQKGMTLPDQCSGGKTMDAEGKVAAVADTVGAGDTFMGGLITGCLGSADSTLLPQLVQKQPFTSKETDLIEDVLKLAVTAAAINCSRTGANPPTRAEVEKAMGGNSFKHLKL
jgi:fructokinase